MGQPDEASHSVRLLRILTLMLAVTGTVTAVAFIARNASASQLLWPALSVLSVSTVVFVAASWRLLRERSRTVRVRPNPRVQRVVEEFVTATRALSTAAREELVYRLVRDGSELPAGAMRRLFTEQTGRLTLSSVTDDRLYAWLDVFLDMDPDDRRAVADRIRSTLL